MIKILLFAQARDAAGVPSLEWDVHEPQTEESLWNWLDLAHPELGAMRSSCRLARNFEYLVGESCFHPGDEIALIPPVSGG